MTAASATQGFVTGLGGFVVLPVALPANLAGALIINARMVGAIAHLRGYNLSDPHVSAMLMLVVAGSSAQGAASVFGVKVGAALTKQAIEKIPMAVLREINKRAGIYLITKYGTKRGLVTLGKAIPFVGAGVGSTFDGGMTLFIGKTAKKVFPALTIPVVANTPDL